MKKRVLGKDLTVLDRLPTEHPEMDFVQFVDTNARVDKLKET